MDKLNFDWNVERLQINFITGSVEFIINEYPKVEINYVDTPIFVPPSSNPYNKAIEQ
jgi:predicted subunit of tRNA(5-methylaminomethyl-2-thiouridylate) methyltransferase